MLSLADIREFVIVPAHMRTGLRGENRVQLTLGTGLVESGYRFLDQTTPGPGPAYGLWQMEEPTHNDLWANYINFQPTALRSSLLEMAGSKYAPPPITVLHWNLMYAAAMCSVHYRRAPEVLPEAGDAEGMAAYWKRWYNTPAGKGSVEKAIPFFKQVMAL